MIVRPLKNSPLTRLLLCLSLIFSIATLPAASLADSGGKTPDSEKTFLSTVNSAFASVLFFDVTGGAIQVPEVDRDNNPVMDPATGKTKMKTIGFPFLVAILAFGAVFFTLYYGFINIFGFRHAIDVVSGKYDKEDDEGEISHFRALTSALSATVGLGNIAGVAVAIQLGGPGSVLWMIILAAFGMSMKFGSCTLAQMYRKVNKDGTISGGPMYYLDIGLKEVSPLLAPLGKVLAILYALFIMGGAVGGGNMFQSNQTAEAFVNTFGLPPAAHQVIGGVLAVLVGVVILGGIKRIGAATSKIVPLMCGLYVIASLVVIFANLPQIPAAVAVIFTQAFTDNAFFGGAFGVLVMGFRRAAFSNEAGIGSAAIAHAAAKTDEPVREGVVAMLGPFIDTIIICFMTSLVIVITGVYSNPELANAGGNLGVTLTNKAFASVIPWFPYVLTVCIGLFAYSTMISWCYYGERGWIYLLDHCGDGVGLKTLPIFRVAYISFTYLGATSALSEVIDFSDLMILSLAFSNIIGSIILAPKVKALLKDYYARLNDGAFSS